MFETRTDPALEHAKYALAGVTPLEVFLRLRTRDEHCFILESLDTSARWTFIGWDAFFEVSINAGRVTQTHTPSGEVVFDAETDPNAFLGELLDTYQQEHYPDLPPFSGGLMGYFAYDYIKYQEPSLKSRLEREKPGQKFNDCDLMLFDKVIAIDHLKNELHIVINHFPNSPFQTGTQSSLDEIYQYISSGAYTERPPLELKSPARYLFSEEQFAEMIQQAKQHINEGDIFQVVLSNRVEFDATGSLFEVYKILRQSNPSPYMFYMSSSSLEIAGASPETLVSALLDTQKGGLVAATYPLAGSRPRGANAAEDEALAQELLSDEKENAEHNMLVDLGRNDIGKVAEIGSVEVVKYMEVLKFAHIMHIGSKVVGRVKRGLKALDVITSVLPAGTLSGAPKVRACEIIDTLEGDNRGIYGGCLGYLSLDGQMDMCITIRSAYMKGGKVFARSGAGIVMDSEPHTEYVETKNKLKAVLNAITQAAGGAK